MNAMKNHGRFFPGFLLLVVAIAVVVAVHLTPLYYLYSHKIASASVLLGAVGLISIVHLGLPGLLWTMFRRWRSRKD
jgi:hypothetical protein